MDSVQLRRLLTRLPPRGMWNGYQVSLKPMCWSLIFLPLCWLVHSRSQPSLPLRTHRSSYPSLSGRLESCQFLLNEFLVSLNFANSCWMRTSWAYGSVCCSKLALILCVGSVADSHYSVDYFSSKKMADVQGAKHEAHKDAEVQINFSFQQVFNMCELIRRKFLQLAN